MEAATASSMKPGGRLHTFADGSIRHLGAAMSNHRRRLECIIFAIQIMGSMLTIADFASSHGRLERIAEVLQKLSDR
jgi:hypothetical protein